MDEETGNATALRRAMLAICPTFRLDSAWAVGKAMRPDEVSIVESSRSSEMRGRR